MALAGGLVTVSFAITTFAVALAFLSAVLVRVQELQCRSGIGGSSDHSGCRCGSSRSCSRGSSRGNSDSRNGGSHSRRGNSCISLQIQKLYCRSRGSDRDGCSNCGSRSGSGSGRSRRRVGRGSGRSSRGRGCRCCSGRRSGSGCGHSGGGDNGGCCRCGSSFQVQHFDRARSSGGRHCGFRSRFRFLFEFNLWGRAGGLQSQQFCLLRVGRGDHSRSSSGGCGDERDSGRRRGRRLSYSWSSRGGKRCRDSSSSNRRCGNCGSGSGSRSSSGRYRSRRRRGRRGSRCS
mmetsp:Transcript_23766/g.41088  ORF Transcript_23766/g.41088 Transcript_23766/m.41088 type:complete len:289 (-) Transcript_23766:464-1330(-)